MKIARVAAACGKNVVPHISGGLGFIYMMHFISALPNAGIYHEFKEIGKTYLFNVKNPCWPVKMVLSKHPPDQE